MDKNDKKDTLRDKETVEEKQEVTSPFKKDISTENKKEDPGEEAAMEQQRKDALTERD